MYVYNDGGRVAAGFKGTTGDCAVRAVAVALTMPYAQAYKELAAANKEAGFAKSVRKGMLKETLDAYLKTKGWKWYKARHQPGRNMRTYDFPQGLYIARMSHHFVAVVNGQAHDIFDCTEKMVYGFWGPA